MNTAVTHGNETIHTSLTLRFVGHLISAAIVIATVIVGLSVMRLYYVYPRTDDAYVRANCVGIAPHVSGPITDLPIVDNQYVKQGDLLFMVDPRPYQATLDSAVAKLQLTELDIRALEDAIRTAQADQVRLEADAAYAKQYLARIEPLLAKHFVTANDVFNARSRVSAAEAAVEGAHSDVRKAQNQLGQYGDINALRKSRRGRRLRRETQRRLLLRARAVQRLRHQPQYRRRPIRQRRPRGRQPDRRPQMVRDRKFPRDLSLAYRPGMTAEVFILAYPNKRFRGHVQGVGWALYQENGATVEGLPQVEPTLNWVRLSQRFPVRIVLDDRDPKFPFRMGNTAVVTIQGYRDQDHAQDSSLPSVLPP